MSKKYGELLNELLHSTRPSEIEEIIHELGSRIDWVPIGNNAGNYGILNIGANPYEGITERITNAIDAMIELAVESDPELKTCANPRQAVARIHGFRDGNLRWCKNDTTLSTLAADIRVKFQDSGERKQPTVEISDRGIGQHPSDFPDTLLGLNDDYKISKLYLMGAFGQGGQMSFSNCKYGVVISRKCPELLKSTQRDLVGWSIVRYRDPSDKNNFYKHGVYEYCIDATARSVLSCSPNSVNKAFFNGTIVKLIAYNLPKGTSDVLQPSSTAWSYLSQSLFDPLLPFTLHEERKDYQEKKRPLSGLARRLWRGGKGERAKIWVNDSYNISLGIHGTVNLNYWALSPTDNLANWRDVRKGYIANNEAGFFTLNGQTHENFSPHFLRDKVRLNYSNEYLIVQVDCDNLTNLAKKELLSTTRERFKENEVKEILFEEVANHLRQDRNILLFEQERKKKILSANNQRDTSRIRNLVARYISNNEELKKLLRKRGDNEVDAKVQRKDESRRHEIGPEELLIPELKAKPTYLKVKNFRDPIPVEKGGNALIRLETDAEDSYYEEEWDMHFRTIHKGGLTWKHSQSRLRNGKISYHIYCPETVRIGSIEEIRFELDLPEGEPLVAERKIMCVQPFEREKVPSSEAFRDPNIVEVSKDDETIELWGEFGWDEKSVGKVIIGDSDPGIYVSVENIEFKKTEKKYPMEFSEEIRNRYVAGVAYYLLLRKMDELKSPNNSDSNFENIVDEDSCPELQRLAKVIAALSMPVEALGSRMKVAT